MANSLFRLVAAAMLALPLSLAMFVALSFLLDIQHYAVEAYLLGCYALSMVLILLLPAHIWQRKDRAKPALRD